MEDEYRKALYASHKAMSEAAYDVACSDFRGNPSAVNYRKLEAAMLWHQAASGRHQALDTEAVEKRLRVCMLEYNARIGG